MRVLGWISVSVVVAGVVAGLCSLAQPRGDASRGLTASWRESAAVEVNRDRRPDPPHMVPARSQSPVLTAAARPPATRTQHSSIVMGSLQRQLINADRAAHGLSPLMWSDCLYRVAVANALRIASQESLSQTDGPAIDLLCRLGNRAGENIGCWSSGVNDSQLNTMFMNSADHYANIAGPYRYMAAAWAIGANGYGYLAVEFS